MSRVTEPEAIRVKARVLWQGELTVSNEKIVVRLVVSSRGTHPSDPCP